MVLGAKGKDREASEIEAWRSAVKAEMNLSNSKPRWEILSVVNFQRDGQRQEEG